MISVQAEILKTLRASPVVLGRLTEDLDDAVLRTRPALGEWAVIEVVAHMADVDVRALERVRRTIVEDRPVLPAFDHVALVDERDYRALPLAAELDRHRLSRGVLSETLERLSDAAWNRTALVAGHGEVSLTAYALHVAAEDVDHLAQISRAIGDVPGPMSDRTDRGAAR